MKPLLTVFMAMLVIALTLPLSAQDNTRAVEQAFSHLQKHAEKHQLKSRDMQAYVVTDAYTSQGITHVYLRQAHDGIEIFGANAAVHSKDDKVIAANNAFLSDVPARITKTSPSLDITEALRALAQTKGFATQLDVKVLEQPKSSNQQMLLSGGNISSEDIPVRLVYIPTKENELKLAWDVVVTDINSPDILSVRIDAQDGKILDEQNWTVYCDFGGGEVVESECAHDHDHAGHTHTLAPAGTSAAEASMFGGSYNVFNYPIESPNHGSRTTVSSPEAFNTTASPDGWHRIGSTDYTVTRGNNVDAYIDDNNTNSPTGGNTARANGGSGLNFDFTWTASGNQANYKDAAVTNLFYWSNLIHDVWYNYGFDEPSGNFQEGNFGRGGAGGDSVNAEAQDGSGTCNANFGTPADGGNPRMQMYLCNGRDGDYDNGVIVHEYGHGISTRLTGGPGSPGCLNNQEQMGEGWSDWFGTMMTIEAGDSGADARGMGTWLIGQGANGAGIRAYPYSTDMGINPQTYNSIKTASVPHGVGSVWATMLWDMSWAFIDEYGYDADLYNGTGGNNMAMAIVIEALKLQPCSPGFVTGRDAILAADQALYNGDNQCLIWDVFARRGLGVGANQGSSNNRSDGTESYDVPAACDNTPPPPPCTDNVVSISITLDNYPEETSWSITNASGATVASSNGTYSGTPDGTTVTAEACLPDGCYDFTINDTYGDGICCSYGNGSYAVTDSDGNTLASGGQFTQSEATNFCVGGGPAPTCDDGIQNGDETGVDCGGSNCSPCPTCDDGIQNGNETGVDCGGPDCAACPTCDDGIQNGNETGVDCGGPDCAACPTCDDGIQNGSETGVDCGGPDCAACPTCDDGIQNGNETGVDCGGPDCAACPTCDDGIQNGNETGVDCGGDCTACPSCDDGIQNGNETGVDCGGDCAPCQTGCQDNTVTVTINLDNYPEETTWAVTNAAGSTVASGGTYGSQPDGSTVTEDLCLPDGCYTFTINDSYGDGICCSYGSGSYSVTNGGTVLASGGQFGSTESTEICVGDQPAPPLTYCGSQGNNVTYEWIQRVQIGSIDNNSGNNNGYADFTGQTISGGAGSSFAVTLTPGFANSSYSEHWRIWIDYNRDGDFSDAGETAFAGNGSGNVSGSFTVPAGVANGDLRMRVSMKYNSAATACESFTYGEVEDYTLLVSGNSFAGVSIEGSAVGEPEYFTYDDRGEMTTLNLFPNPVKGILSVQLNLADEKAAQVRITDISGKTVLAPVNAAAVRGTQTLRMNTTALESGIYYVQLITETETLTKKVVVME